MNRFIRPLVIKTHKHAFSLALLLVFLVRALIPMGYMPALNQGPSARLSLSLCITGLSAATVQALALDASQGQPEHSSPYCVFSSILGNSGPPSPAVFLLPFDFFSGLLLPLSRGAAPFTWLVRGPPLGSRAPPV